MSIEKVWRVRIDGEMVSIKRSDVESYFSHSHGMSGVRSLGPVSGDWRMIDDIAEGGREYFGI